MAFDTTSLLMFAFLFIVGFTFSILALVDLLRCIENKKRSPWMGLVGSFISAIVWLCFALVWLAGATELFVGFGWLWLAFTFIYVAFAFASAGLILKNSVKGTDEMLHITTED